MTQQKKSKDPMARAKGLIGEARVRQLEEQGLVVIDQERLDKLERALDTAATTRMARDIKQERQELADGSIFYSTFWHLLRDWAHEHDVLEGLSGTEQKLVEQVALWERYAAELLDLYYRPQGKVTPTDRVFPHLRAWLDAIAQQETLTPGEQWLHQAARVIEHEREETEARHTGF